MDLYNATVEIHRSDNESKIFRVFPDFPIRLFKAGQYGSLGLASDEKENKLVKRAYSIASPMIDLSTNQLSNQKDLKYLEFYINKVNQRKKKEQITPKLFELKSGDRMFCGEKIVGHYTAPENSDWKNIVFVSTHTGESPNNSIINHLLLQGSKATIININVGNSWKSLYTEEHQAIEKLYKNYRFLQFQDNSPTYNRITNFIANFSENEEFSALLDVKETLFYLCGDPLLIGAPVKKGGWEYQYPDYGIVNVLTKKSFEISTRFKKGNITCESYW